MNGAVITNMIKSEDMAYLKRRMTDSTRSYHTIIIYALPIAMSTLNLQFFWIVDL